MCDEQFYVLLCQKLLRESFEPCQVKAKWRIIVRSDQSRVRCRNRADRRLLPTRPKVSKGRGWIFFFLFRLSDEVANFCRVPFCRPGFAGLGSAQKGPQSDGPFVYKGKGSTKFKPKKLAVSKSSTKNEVSLVVAFKSSFTRFSSFTFTTKTRFFVPSYIPCA